MAPMLSLYCDSMSCRQLETTTDTERKMEKDFNDIPLSESNVSLKLADIQKRCSELMQESDDNSGLTLEEPALQVDDNNPYNRG